MIQIAPGNKSHMVRPTETSFQGRGRMIGETQVLRPVRKNQTPKRNAGMMECSADSPQAGARTWIGGQPALRIRLPAPESALGTSLHRFNRHATPSTFVVTSSDVVYG